MRVIKYEISPGIPSARFVVDAEDTFHGNNRIARTGLFQICRYLRNDIPVTNKTDLDIALWALDARQEQTKRNTINGNGWFVDALYREGVEQSPFYLDSFNQDTRDGLTQQIRTTLAAGEFLDHWLDPQGFVADHAAWADAETQCMATGGPNNHYLFLWDTPEQHRGVSLEFKVHLLGVRTDNSYVLGPGFYWEWRSLATGDLPDIGISALTASNQVPDNDVTACLQMWIAANRNNKKILVSA